MRSCGATAQRRQERGVLPRRARAAAAVVERGVWANKPVPLFPYPGSPDYSKRWGAPDDRAWERAIDFYLETYHAFSDIQNDRPLPLRELELDAR